jgi:hypothetical protein
MLLDRNGPGDREAAGHLLAEAIDGGDDRRKFPRLDR